MSSYWLGKNVLITGSNGFIGANLAKALIEKGAHVFGLIRSMKKQTMLFYEKLDRETTLIQGDLCDKDLFCRILSEEQIHAVFHLAAQVEVGVGMANPYLTYETNIRGTYSLLEAVRCFPDTVESVVVASTDKSYGSYPREKMPYKEDYPLIPRYPYDVSKACADMIAQAYATEVYNLPIVVTRFCNIYGPGQLNFSALIPDAIRSCLGYSEFIPRGNGQQVRDFVYIEDVVDLYLRIGEALANSPEKHRGHIYNAGTNKAHSVREVLEKVFAINHKEEDFKKVLAMMKGKVTIGEIDCQFMDYEKVNAHFGWSPTHTFDQALVKTNEWFRGYLESIYA